MMGEMQDVGKTLLGLLVGHKRVLGFVLIPIAVALIIASIGWYLVLPQYRPALRSGEVYGIDVSEHQTPLDWKKVADDDISFAYIKATEGSSSQDGRFKNHIKGAKDAGLRVGAYHYFSLCSPGKTQAENFLKMIKSETEMLPPVLDLEFSPFCDEVPTRDDVLKQVDDYRRIVSDAIGKQVVLYVGADFDKDYRIKQHYDDSTYWQLRYLRRPADNRDQIWQVGNFFKIDGAPGRVDLNVGRIDGW